MNTVTEIRTKAWRFQREDAHRKRVHKRAVKRYGRVKHSDLRKSKTAREDRNN